MSATVAQDMNVAAGPGRTDTQRQPSFPRRRKTLTFRRNSRHRRLWTPVGAGVTTRDGTVVLSPANCLSIRSDRQASRSTPKPASLRNEKKDHVRATAQGTQRCCACRAATAPCRAIVMTGALSPTRDISAPSAPPREPILLGEIENRHVDTSTRRSCPTASPTTSRSQTCRQSDLSNATRASS